MEICRVGLVGVHVSVRGWVVDVLTIRGDDGSFSGGGVKLRKLQQRPCLETGNPDGEGLL